MRLLQQIRERAPSLPKAQQQVIDAICQAPEECIGLTVAQIAQKAHVSMPSVVRTCRSFGFLSVREFMMALAQDIAITASGLHHNVNIADSLSEIVAKILGSAISSIGALEAQIDLSALKKATEAIAKSDRTDCYSAGATSTFIANDLQARLFRLGLHTNAFVDPHLQLISAATLGKKGVAIAISHVGRLPALLEASRFAKSQGATVIALTQPNTLLAKEADILLAVSVPEDAVMRVGTEAYIAHLLVIEILTVLIGQKLGNQAVKRLGKFRAVLEEHGIDSQLHMALQMSWSKAEQLQDWDEKSAK